MTFFLSNIYDPCRKGGSLEMYDLAKKTEFWEKFLEKSKYDHFYAFSAQTLLVVGYFGVAEYDGIVFR